MKATFNMYRPECVCYTTAAEHVVGYYIAGSKFKSNLCQKSILL